MQDCSRDRINRKKDSPYDPKNQGKQGFGGICAKKLTLNHGWTRIDTDTGEGNNELWVLTHKTRFSDYSSVYDWFDRFTRLLMVSGTKRYSVLTKYPNSNSHLTVI